MEIDIFGTPLLAWLVAFLAIVLLGFSKGGIKGMSVILITLLVYVYGGRHSTGILMPLLVAADILAIVYYRKHVQWKYLFMLLPAMLGGVLIGTFIGKDLPEAQFKMSMIFIILAALVVLLYWELRPPKKVPDNWLFSSAIGLIAGVTTMIGNLAGPFANIYFLSIRLPKNAFIGTAAWLFFVTNLFKIPIHIFYWGTINVESFKQSISLVPALVIGFCMGVWLVTKINDKHYRLFIIGVTAIGALVLLFK